VVVFQGDEDKDAHLLEGVNVTITEAKTRATMNKGMSQATAELATYCLAKGYSLLKSSTIVSEAKGCLISIPSVKGFLTTGRLWRFLCFKRNSHAGGEGTLFATSSAYDIGDQLENLDFVIGLISSWVSCVILDLLGNSHATYQTANSLTGEFKPFTATGRT